MGLTTLSIVLGYNRSVKDHNIKVTFCLSFNFFNMILKILKLIRLTVGTAKWRASLWCTRIWLMFLSNNRIIFPSHLVLYQSQGEKYEIFIHIIYILFINYIVHIIYIILDFKLRIGNIWTNLSRRVSMRMLSILTLNGKSSDQKLKKKIRFIRKARNLKWNLTFKLRESKTSVCEWSIWTNCKSETWLREV